jgi:uncharacterized protein YegJ (DUF2314 family)
MGGIRGIALAAALLMAAPGANAESILSRSRRDAIGLVPDKDPIMEAAFGKARATLPKFLALARDPRPGITSMAVKVALDQNGQYEYFWISKFVEHGGWITGRIDNEPRMVKHVRFGDEITFATEDVVDWLYRENEKMIGNYTGCALMRRERPSEAEKFKRRFGLNCDD